MMNTVGPDYGKARILDGNIIAENLLDQVNDRVTRFQLRHERAPGLAVVLVGSDEASQIYVRKKGPRARGSESNPDPTICP